MHARMHADWMNHGPLDRPNVDLARGSLGWIMTKTAAGFYAVAAGRTVGVFKTWDECQAQVNYGSLSVVRKRIHTMFSMCVLISLDQGILKRSLQEIQNTH